MGTRGVVVRTGRGARGFAKQGRELPLLFGREVGELPRVKGLEADDGVVDDLAATGSEVQVVAALGDVTFDEVLPFELRELVRDVALGDEESPGELLLGEPGPSVDVSEDVELHDGETVVEKRGFDFLEGVVVGACQERPHEEGASFGA